MDPVAEALVEPGGTFKAKLPTKATVGKREIELYFTWSDTALGDVTTSANVDVNDLTSQGVDVGQLVPDSGTASASSDTVAPSPSSGDVVEDLEDQTREEGESIEPGETGGVVYPKVDVGKVGTDAAVANGPVTAQECRAMYGQMYWHYIAPYGTISNTSRNVYVPVQRVKTESRTTARYDLEHSKGTKTSAFFQSGSTFVSGGVTTAMSQSSGAGAGVNIGHGKSRIVKVKYNYRKMKQMCSTSAGTSGTTWWNMAGRSWQPQKAYLGQFDYGWWSKPFRCYEGNQRYFNASDMWVARTSAFYFSGSFTLAGALGASREQNSSTVSKKTHIKRSGYYGFSMCGQDDAEPKLAKDMKEIPPKS